MEPFAALDTRAKAVGFPSHAEHLAWLRIMDELSESLDDYDQCRSLSMAPGDGRGPSTARGRALLLGQYGEPRPEDRLVADAPPVLWKQNGLQVFRDECVFASVLRELPWDTGFRAQLLSNARMGGSSPL